MLLLIPAPVEEFEVMYNIASVQMERSSPLSDCDSELLELMQIHSKFHQNEIMTRFDYLPCVALRNIL